MSFAGAVVTANEAVTLSQKLAKATMVLNGIDSASMLMPYNVSVEYGWMMTGKGALTASGACH